MLGLIGGAFAAFFIARAIARDKMAQGGTLHVLVAYLRAKKAKVCPTYAICTATSPLGEVFCYARRCALPAHSLSILFVRDVLHPFYRRAVQFLLDRYMTHGRRCRSAVPVLFARRKPDDIAGADFLNRAAVSLNPAKAGAKEKGLSQRMRVPRRARTRFKGDEGTRNTGWIGGLNRGSIRTVPVNHSAGPLPDGCAPLRLISMVVIPFANGAGYPPMRV